MPVQGQPRVAESTPYRTPTPMKALPFPQCRTPEQQGRRRMNTALSRNREHTMAETLEVTTLRPTPGYSTQDFVTANRTSTPASSARRASSGAASSRPTTDA